MLLKSWFSIGSEQANEPTTGVSLERAMPVIVSSVGRVARPVTSTYWNPWNVNRGSQSIAPDLSQMYVSVTRASRRFVV